MRKIYFLFIIVLGLFINQAQAQIDSTLSRDLQKQQLKSFISSLPLASYQQSFDDMDKSDRPDLRAEHDFLMTFDPYLGYVPKERLFEAYRITKQRLSDGKNPIPGATWTERGPNNVGGRTRALMFDPNDVTNKKVWAGGVGGGLWYNNDITNAASTWQRVDDFWSNIAITCIAYDPTNTQVFYVGTGEGFYNADAIYGGGIWKTSDGGATWAQLASTDPGQYPSGSNFTNVHDIIVNSSGDVFVAAKGYYINRGGVLKSTDGGATWNVVLSPYNGIGVPANTTIYDRGTDLEIASNGDIYATIGQFSTGKLYKTTNNGTSWTDITPATGGNRIEVTVAPSNSSVLYAVADDGTGSVAWFKKSTNGGTSWTNVTIPKYLEQSCSYGSSDYTRGQAWYDLILAVHPTNPDVVYAGGIDINRSINGGSTWSTISYWTGVCRDEVHADQHAIAFRPGANNEMVFGNDGGVYYSSNSGNSGVANPTFDISVNGYNVTQFYSCAMLNSSGSNYFLAGAQDNGSHKFTVAGINSTTEVTGGDGAFCFIDQDNSNYQITSYINNYWYRSTNGGASFSGITSSTSGRFINPADYDNDADIIYSAAGDDQLYRVSGITGAITATTKTCALGGTQASAIIASPYSANTLFVGTDLGEVFKITNANGATLTSTQIDGGSLPAGYISCIEVGASDNQLLVTFSSYGVQHVWETLNGGGTWTDKTGNLPDMPVRFALYNPNDRTQVLLATEIGTWSTTDVTAGTPDWDPTNSGLANVRCDYLQYRSSDKMVAVATHGRGLYTSDCFSIPMTYVSSTTTQNNTSDVALGTTNAEIIGIEIVTSGSTSPLDVTSFTINTTGTTNALADIDNAKIYYTGSSSTFATTNQFGTTVAVPNGSHVVNGTQTLFAGTNYFWLVYDIDAAATAGDFVDAQCTSLTVGTAKTPTVTNPAGNRKIVADPCLVTTYPYTQNFDSWTTSSPVTACTGDGTVTFEECWTNVVEGGIDWDIFAGSTASSGTGPSSDHTTGSGNYLYTESSGTCQGVGYITSPPFDFSSFTDATLSFWYHMYGVAMQTMSVQVSTNGGSTWSADVWSLSGDQGNSWIQATIDLTAYAGQSNVVLRWTGDLSSNSSFTSDMAIDDINVDGNIAVTSIVWDGSVSSDWQTLNNWTPNTAIPTSSDNVVIPNGMPNYPLIDDGVTTAECNNVTIENAANVTIAPNGQMTVFGEITNGAGNAGLYIQSDATGTGSLIHNSTSGVDATVELFFEATPRRWHMIASPVTAAPLTVFPSTANLYVYDETTADYWTGINYDAGSVIGWVPPSGNMIVAKGYVFNGNQSTFNFTGQLNQNTATNALNVIYTNHGVNAPNGASYNDFDGWNFFGNPYTSAIDWNNAGINHAAANLLDAVYYYDDKVNHTYASYVNGTGTNGGTRYIPAMQGFFVKGDASETPVSILNIPASALVHNSQAFWKDDMLDAAKNTLNLSVIVGNFEDETVVRFDDNATNGMDNKFDAYKLFTWEDDVPQIFTKIDGASTEYSINTLSLLNNDQILSIPLIVETKAEKFVITVNELNFDNTNVYLKDNSSSSANNFIQLSNLQSYVFTRSTLDNKNRFELVFEKSKTQINDFATPKLVIYPNPSSGSFYLNVADYQGDYDVIVTDVAGKIIYQNSFSGKEIQNIELNKSQGIYFINVKINNQQTLIHKVVIQ
ncbi:MAG: T9SS type A sorting domain-containing protein [Bacteroidales bacterium]|nr:T9SS type A sorting domain-containing protein [Bacteroidales bacterium]